jgi:hypothetical protein
MVLGNSYKMRKMKKVQRMMMKRRKTLNFKLSLRRTKKKREKVTTVMMKVIILIVKTVKMKNYQKKECLGMKWRNNLKKKIGESLQEDKLRKQLSLSREWLTPVVDD